MSDSKYLVDGKDFPDRPLCEVDVGREFKRRDGATGILRLSGLKYAPWVMSGFWYCSNGLHHAGIEKVRLIAPVAAATGQPQEVIKESLNAEIEVGDTVAVTKARCGADYQGRVLSFYEGGGGPCARIDDGTPVAEFVLLANCRLVSKGKSGQGELGRAVGERGPRAGTLANAGLTPCPACHGSGRQAGFSDFDTVPCGKCQYGKPAPEPEVARPYHKVLPSGECVICNCTEAYFTPEDDAAATEYGYRELARQEAREALAKAQTEAKRLGVL